MGLVPPIDYCARRAKARADVATLRVVLDEVKPTKPKDTHVINITNKKEKYYYTNSTIIY